MKIAIYPGSFNPWHEGHTDVLAKACQVFDRVVIAQGVNPDKNLSERERIPAEILAKFHPHVTTAAFKGLFVDFLKGREYHAVIKGLRNIQDFEYEKTQQYWNEDLGQLIPVFYVIADRKLVHISSSALRMINGIKK